MAQMPRQQLPNTWRNVVVEVEPEDGGEEASQGELDDPVGHHDPGRRVQQAVLARKPIWKNVMISD